MAMKPTADEDQILTGQDAIDHVVDTWQDLGQDKVEIELREPYLVVRRSGGHYSAFISLVDGTAATILDDTATTRHIPKQHRPETGVPDERIDTLAHAFEHSSGGIFPRPDDGVLVFNYDDGNRRELRVGLTTDTFEVCDT